MYYTIQNIFKDNLKLSHIHGGLEKNYGNGESSERLSPNLVMFEFSFAPTWLRCSLFNFILYFLLFLPVFPYIFLSSS